MKKLDIVKRNKTYYLVSLTIMIILFAISMFYKINTGSFFNYGVEFSGGTAIAVDIGQEFNNDDLENIVQETTGVSAPQIQKVVGSNEVTIKLPEITQEQRISLIDSLVETYDIEESDINISAMSATISGEMRESAMVAVTIAIIAILGYITIRFGDLKMGISSILALMHDALIVLLFYSAFRIQLNYAFIAVMLTVIGYSINSTIVIFDKVRENKKRMLKYSDNEIVNASVNETITRSVYTSITTILPLVCLYILGVSSIREFSLPIVIGIFAGTYSSVFISANLWNSLTKSGVFDKFETKDDENITPKRYRNN